MASVSPALRTETYQWHTEEQRSDSRASSRYVPLNHAGVVTDTLDTVVDGVNATTELIRRKYNENLNERRAFQTEMEINGRISVQPNDADRLTRLQAVSTEDIQKELNKIKDHQKQNAVKDTLAALVYDIDATAEVLRRKQQKPNEEVEYKLRITPEVDTLETVPKSPKPRHDQSNDDNFTLEHVSKDYGVEVSESQTNSLKKRSRSETPRRTINVELSPPPSSLPICAYCSEEIEGPIITALAPNSYTSQKFHPNHFMCTYCQKALNLRGTYREHERKPYCHECFYRLYNGLIYAPDIKQTKIEKLI
uniref:LIM zinc-binding domain-containing protein n=1 Tax=Syphacia muris TaxID=451379 RepID=A0A0N5AP97_9BILA